ncbi:VOC family protein [Marinobacter salarius]|uniref:VOC family protein n=1 Tax=Marinobacter salarius TaxID=1420917 RepID=UPI0032ED5C37
MLTLSIDHLLIASQSLDAGMNYLESLFGRAPTVGGSHPGQASRNALLSLEDDCYIEVIAPDPAQTPTVFSEYLATVEKPSLLWWAARTEDLDQVAEEIQAQGDGGTRAVCSQGSRALADGRGTLRWDVLVARGAPAQNLMPFFIRWSSLAEHPSRGGEPVGRLRTLRLSGPEVDRLSWFRGACLDPHVAQNPGLEVEIDTPRGVVSLSSPLASAPGVGDLLG